MKQFFILLSLVTIGFSSTTITIATIAQCSCGNAKTTTDCVTTYCNWDSTNSACSNKSCSTVNVKDDCIGLPDPFGCAWNVQNGTCEAFTKCSDYSYKISDAESCYELVKCQPDFINYNSTNERYGCMDRASESFLSISDCTKVPFGKCQWLVQSDNKQCLQNTATQICEAKTISSCADYSAAQCNAYSCYLNDNNVCSQVTCSLLPQNRCYIFPSFDSKSMLFCSWKNNACVDLDLTTLTEVECLSATFYSYLWNQSSSKCELCTSITNSFSMDSLYATILLLTVIMN